MAPGSLDLASSATSGPAYSGVTGGSVNMSNAPVLNLGNGTSSGSNAPVPGFSIPTWAIVGGFVLIVVVVVVLVRKKG